MLNCRCGTICRMSSNFWLRGWQTSTNLASFLQIFLSVVTRNDGFSCVFHWFSISCLYPPLFWGVGPGWKWHVFIVLLICLDCRAPALRESHVGNPRTINGRFLSGKIVEQACHNHHLLTSLQKMDENGIFTAWLQEPNFRPRKSSIIQLVLAPVQFNYSQDSSYCGHRKSWFFTSNMGGSCSFSHKFWEVKLNHQPLQEGYEFWYPQGFGIIHDNWLGYSLITI